MDLVEHLAEQAAEAVRKRRAAIESGEARNLRGITIDIELANGGAVLDVTAHLSWKSIIRAARGGS